MLTEERIKEIKEELQKEGLFATDEFIIHFFDYTEEEIKALEERILLGEFD